MWLTEKYSKTITSVQVSQCWQWVPQCTYNITCWLLLNLTTLLSRAGTPEDLPAPEVQAATAAVPMPQSTVIPGVDSLTGDLLNLDLGPPLIQQQPVMGQASQSAPVIDPFGDGMDSLVSSSGLTCLVFGVIIFITIIIITTEHYVCQL